VTIVRTILDPSEPIADPGFIQHVERETDWRLRALTSFNLETIDREWYVYLNGDYGTPHVWQPGDPTPGRVTHYELAATDNHEDHEAAAEDEGGSDT
jgi:hypothetical protein